MMKNRIITTLTVGTLALLSVSCDKAKEAAETAKNAAEAAKEMDLSNLGLDGIPDKAVGMLDGLPDALGEIKDEASLEAAKPKIDAITSKLGVLTAAIQKIPGASGDAGAKVADVLNEKVDAFFDGEKMEAMEEKFKGLSESNPALGEKLDGIKNQIREAITGLLGALGPQE